MRYILLCLGLLILAVKCISNTNNRIYFSPESANDFKKTPIIELTKSNMKYILPSQTCNVVFATNYGEDDIDHVNELKKNAKQIAGLFRHDSNVLVSHIGFDHQSDDDDNNNNNINNILKKSKITVVKYKTHFNKPVTYSVPKYVVTVNSILKWIKQKCLNAQTNPFEEEQDLSVIFKTNKTLAILANGFDVSKEILSWVRKYCKDYPLNPRYDKVNVLDAKNTSLKKFLCLHGFGGRPFILKNAISNWPAMEKWKPNGTWVKSMATAILSADIGVERGWGGTNLLPEEYLNYMLENEDERRNNNISNKNVKPPPWSSIYAYTHQHTKLNMNVNDNDNDNQRVPEFVADVMWNDFTAPKIFNQQNWFRYMGECFKMMAVTFWSTEGARQSNHQDDFGSSKWNAQIYGKKKWIMHPPEESAKLYNGLVDPFAPDYKRYPLYRDVKRLEFVLDEGDVIFFSAGWWHATLALENSLAIAQNILSEHNYMEFRRQSRKACKPDGSHGIYSPWCACFRRTYGKWDALYQKWLNSIKTCGSDSKNMDQEIANYKFEKFRENIENDGNHDDEAVKHSHPHLLNSIEQVLETVKNDTQYFLSHKSFPIDTAGGNTNDNDFYLEL
jgi:hypothetical protein